MKNEDVFNAIEEYSTDLYRFCIHLCRSKDSADELFQETFLKTAEMSHKIDRSKNIRSFLFSIAISVFRNEKRKALRRSIIAPSASEYELETLADTSDVLSDTIKSERHRILSELVYKLDEKYKYSVILFYGMQQDISSIAKTLKCPCGTVKSRLSRARQILKKEMEALGYGEE